MITIFKFAAHSTMDHKKLQKVVCTAYTITEANLLSMDSIYMARCRRKAANIIKTPSHPGRRRGFPEQRALLNRRGPAGGGVASTLEEENNNNDDDGSRQQHDGGGGARQQAES
eukprot:g34044.t1